MRYGIRLIASLLIVSSLSACGVKGPLEPPPKAKQDGTATTGAGTPGTKPKDEPHKPFVLDGILR